MAETRSGMISGGVAGFQYAGPAGMIIGGAIGAAFGSSARRKRNKEEYKILQANTRQSYSIGQSTLSGINKSREDIAKNYSRDMASAKAKYAASGGRLEGKSYQNVLGSVSRARDNSLEQANIDEDAYRKSQAYKFIKDDFDYMAKMNSKTITGPGYNDYDYEKLSIRTEGRTGESYFTDKQKGNLRTLDATSRNRDLENDYLTYQQSITPTMQEYEQYKFGNEDDKARFESDMTQRIDQANTLYDEQVLENDLRFQRKQEQGNDY